MKNLFPLLCAVLVVFASCNKEVAEWENWRGPNRNGVVAGIKWAPELLDSSKIIWEKEIGSGHSGILVDAGKCYATGWQADTISKDSTGISTIFCMELETGNELWQYNYSAKQRSFPGPRSTPAISEGMLYQLSWEGVLFCINAETGAEVWKKDIVSDSTTRADRWGCSTSPVIFENMILLNQNKSGLAIDKTTGDVIWTSERSTGSMTSTTLFDYQDKKLGTFTSDSTTYLVDVRTGEVEMHYVGFSSKNNWVDVNISPEGELYLNNELVKIDNNEFISLWQNDSITSYFTVGGIKDGYAYQLGNPKQGKTDLNCVDLKTGKTTWSEKVENWGATLIVNDKIVLMGGLGMLKIIEASPEAYKEISSVRVFEKKRKEPCWTIPTVVDGKILVRNSTNKMACIDLEI